MDSADSEYDEERSDHRRFWGDRRVQKGWVKYTSGELFFESQHTSQREPLKGKSEHISLLFTIPISLSVKAKILTMAYKALNIMLSPAPPSTLTSSLTVIL